VAGFYSATATASCRRSMAYYWIAANRTLATLNGPMNWAAREDIIGANPCTGIRPPGIEKARHFILCGASQARRLAIPDISHGHSNGP
jgi:hypothetical protein